MPAGVSRKVPTLSISHARYPSGTSSSGPQWPTDFGAAGDVDLHRLHRELALIRKRGFAINNQLTEPGVTAVGVAVHECAGQPNAAISISMPSVRFRRDHLTAWANELTTTAAVIERDLQHHGSGSPAAVSAVSPES